MIHALGWCDMERWGCVGAHVVSRHGTAPDLSASAEAEMLIGRRVRYYSRMPIQTRLSLIAMSQALRASRWVETGMREIGMTAAGYDGCLDADHRYFRDYVETGRVTGRGSLFIYTLATSTVGEAAIALRLSGPALYVHSDVAPVTTLIEQSRQMAAEGQSQGVLALWSDIRAAVCFAVGAEAGDGLDDMLEGHWESSPGMLARHLTANVQRGVSGMEIRLIYPRWPKLRNQPEFHLPPHGPVVFAAALPAGVQVDFIDENVQEVDFSEQCDLVCISCMLTCQMPRAFRIADRFREMGKKVIFGGIGTSLHAQEVRRHADSVFLGEAEGRMEAVLRDFEQGRLQPVYDYQHDFPDTRLIGRARRSILAKERYNFRGVQMVDLVHASRGCRFSCFPCCVPFLGGRCLRTRPIDKVVDEVAAIDNSRLFFVDNSFAQCDQWQKDLFRALAPLKKKWISHPIKDDDETLDLAAAAGCWYVYQAVINTSPVIARRIKRLKERGIGVEGTVILGTDEHDEDAIRRLVDFLLDLDLDLAEFTVMTPLPHTPIRAQLAQQGRIFSDDWIRYTCDQTVFKPAQMSAGKLDELYQYAWDTFYADCSVEVKMAKLYVKVIEREKADGTYRRVSLNRRKWDRDASPTP